MKIKTDTPLSIRDKIVRNHNAPIDELIELSKDDNLYIRWNVAMNPSTPLDILIELSKDKDENVRDCAIRYRINRMGLLK